MVRPIEQISAHSVVLYQLGGGWVAEFVHAALGTPGLSTIRKYCTTLILPSSIFPMPDELNQNIKSVYEYGVQLEETMGLICMFDKIKVDVTNRAQPPRMDIPHICTWTFSRP